MLLVGVFVAGALLAAAAVVVRGTILRPATYASALVEADVYQRIYTEVLADPELAALKEELLGGLGIPAPATTQVRAVTTSALRWAVPPSTVRRGSEAAIEAVLAYVRGETDTLEVRIDGGELLLRVEPTVVTEVATLLAVASELVATGIAEHRDDIAAFAGDLRAGRVPTSVPVIDLDTVDRQEVADAILEQLGPLADDRARAAVRGLVAGGDEAGALIVAARLLVVDHAAAARERLADGLPDQRGLDLVAATAARAEQTRGDVVATLGPLRTAARLIGWPTAVGGLLLMGLAGVLMFARSDPRRAAAQLAVGTALAGVGVALVWAIVTRTATSPLAPATATGAGSWNLPAGVRSVVDDVEAEIWDTIAATVRVLAVAGVVTGLVSAIALVVIPRFERSPRRALLTTAAVTGLTVAFAGAVVAGSSTAATTACNGHPELCDRPYDEVVYGATHNAMSDPDTVAIWPEHDHDLRQQLDDGVRALLIDTHYWRGLTTVPQLTAVSSVLPAGQGEVITAELDQRREPRDGAFLCHVHCAFGGVELVEALASIGAFMADNPDEVVTLIIEDAISPEDTVEAFEAAGLDEVVHIHRRGERWPTLGELIGRDERLVVLAENEGPPPGWYHQAFELMQETPFLFLSPDQFSCEPNRGDADASLVQLNHWVQRLAPDRTDSVVVNARSFIVDRVEQCRDERGLLANYVAVNFSNIGDLRGAVDTLNGVGSF